MDRKAAKELIHIKGWLDRVDEIVERGKDAYLADDLLQGSRRLADDEARRGGQPALKARGAGAGRSRVGPGGGEP